MGQPKKVGNLPVTQAQIAAAESFVAKASQQLASTTPLTAVERKRVVKLWNGVQSVVPTVASLLVKYELQSRHVSMDDSSSLIAYAASLRALLLPVILLEKTIKDEILRSEGLAWKSTTVSYGLLQKVAESVPALAIELVGVEKWFRRGAARAKARVAAAETAAPATVNPPPKA